MFRRVTGPFFPILVALALLAFAVWYGRTHPAGEPAASAERFAHVGCGVALDAYHKRVSPTWVTVSGRILAALPDSDGRFRHQRFIVGCSDGLSLLIVNDVTVGQRIPTQIGGRVIVRGQYVWDSRGGLIHHTHHSDTGGTDGWIFVGSRVYR